MISFDTEDGRFNYRSVAVIIHDEHVLIHTAEEDDFWALPGGRVELLEYSNATVTREIAEELGLESRVERHLWHVESFFEYQSHRCHEIANYYLVSLPRPPIIQSEIDFQGIEVSDYLTFRWVPLERIGDYDIKPEFLTRRLSNLPNTVEWLQRDDIREG